ncbi:hypothetical protein CVT26_001222, partial [Gymnopilus dilepis]
PSTFALPSDVTSSQTTGSSWASVLSGPSSEEVVQVPKLREVAAATGVGRRVNGETVRSVPTLLPPATTPTSAANVGAQEMLPMPAPMGRVSDLPNRFNISHNRPCYAWDFIWQDDDDNRTLCAASEFFDPLPCVSAHKLNNTVLSQTIRSYPDLFAIVIPVRIHTLRNLLVSHPNQPFIDSACHGLTHGFWPWADSADSNFSSPRDVEEYVNDPAHGAFAEEQRVKEIVFGTFSPAFFKLWPGMLSVPITMSPKARTRKLRLCVNHSAEPFSRNSLIPRSAIAVPLDNLHNLGSPLSAFRELAGWISWALNVYPLLRPGLCALYEKMRGKSPLLRSSVRIVWKQLLVTTTLPGCMKLRAIPAMRKRPLTRVEIRTSLTSSSPPTPTTTSSSELFSLRYSTDCSGWVGAFNLTRLHSVMLDNWSSDCLFEGTRILINSTSSLDDPYVAFSAYVNSRDNSIPLKTEFWLREGGSVPT